MLMSLRRPALICYQDFINLKYLSRGAYVSIHYQSDFMFPLIVSFFQGAVFKLHERKILDSVPSACQCCQSCFFADWLLCLWLLLSFPFDWPVWMCWPIKISLLLGWRKNRFFNLILIDFFRVVSRWSLRKWARQSTWHCEEWREGGRCPSSCHHKRGWEEKCFSQESRRRE